MSTHGTPTCTSPNTLNCSFARQGSAFSLFLHDAVVMYALAAQKAYDMGEDPRNGSLMFQLALDEEFEGRPIQYSSSRLTRAFRRDSGPDIVDPCASAPAASS